MSHIIIADNCAFDKDKLPDVQNTGKNFYRTPIQRVGIRHIEVPILVWQKTENRPVEIHAQFAAYVNLTEDSKGINMSRCGRVIIEQAKKHMDETIAHMNTSTFNLLESIVSALREQHQSSTAYVKCKFSYPYWTKTYASNIEVPEYVDITWEAVQDSESTTNLLTVENVGLSLCPCSKEMSMLKNNLSEKEMDEMVNLSSPLLQKILSSGWGAHNQRSHVTVTVSLKPGEILWFEDLIELTNKSFSAPILNILKREDERTEGELAYCGGYWATDKTTDTLSFYPIESTGPKFVEDIARDAARQLDKLLDCKITDYLIQVVNDESIHSRELQAVAILSAGRVLQ
jgi:GTP cyclohydrolase FolE2